MNPSNDSNAHFGAVTGAYTPPTTIHNIAPLRIRVDRTFPLRNLRVARLLHPAVHEHLARSAVALAAAVSHLDPCCREDLADLLPRDGLYRFAVHRDLVDVRSLFFLMSEGDIIRAISGL